MPSKKSERDGDHGLLRGWLLVWKILKVSKMACEEESANLRIDEASSIGM